jgi:uncharacterized protein DUF5946
VSQIERVSPFSVVRVLVDGDERNIRSVDERTRGVCPGCDGSFAAVDGPTHPYMTGSSGCWRTFGDVLAADYADPERMAFHQLVIDAYAAQHPGDGDRRQVQSVGLHLMTLCLFLEHAADPALGTELHRRMIRRPSFHRLERSGPGSVTVADVPVHGDVDAARRVAFTWAADVWQTYAGAHDIVVAWLREAGFEVSSP